MGFQFMKMCVCACVCVSMSTGEIRYSKCLRLHAFAAMPLINILQSQFCLELKPHMNIS